MIDDIEKKIQDISRKISEQGISDSTSRWFRFRSNAPVCMRNKHASLQLSLIIGCFFSGFFFREDKTFYLIMLGITAALCVWYYYDARFMRYYRKASKAMFLRKYEKAWSYFSRILNSRRLYLEGMPVAYYVLKAEYMLNGQDQTAADYLNNQASKMLLRSL